MITVELAGGLGNQLFQYAAGRALSVLHGVPIRLDRSFLDDRQTRPDITPREYSLGPFRIPAGLDGRYPPPISGSFLSTALLNIRRLFEPGLPRFYKEPRDGRFAPLQSLGPHCYIRGYFQSEQHFLHITEVIREEVRLREGFDAAAINVLDSIERTKSVAVFVRRGEFVSNPITNRFHGVCPSSFYSNAASMLQERFEGLTFFIFSDDLLWCQQHLSQLSNVQFVGHQAAGLHYAQYLMIMSQCRHFIVSNSSFGWWGAWLNPDPRKIVIAPRRWYRDTSMDTTHLLPKGWLAI